MLAAIAAVALAVTGVFELPRAIDRGSGGATSTETLPPPWRISVDVLNGGGDIAYTRRLADRIGSMAYQIKHVSPADRFDYPETAVYFPPGGEKIGQRLAAQLGVERRPLPSENPRRLVVIAVPRALG